MDRHRKLLDALGLGLFGFYCLHSALFSVKSKIDNHFKTLRKTVDERCGVSLNDYQWKRLTKTKAWREIRNSYRLSTRDVLSKLRNEAAFYITGMASTSLAVKSGVSSFKSKKDFSSPIAASFFAAANAVSYLWFVKPVKLALAPLPDYDSMSSVCWQARHLSGEPEPVNNSNSNHAPVKKTARRPDKSAEIDWASVMIAGGGTVYISAPVLIRMSQNIANSLSGMAEAIGTGLSGLMSVRVPVPIFIVVPGARYIMDDYLSESSPGFNSL